MRALRWLSEQNRFQAEKSKGGDPLWWGKEEFIDYVWLAPLGEGFGGT